MRIALAAGLAAYLLPSAPPGTHTAGSVVARRSMSIASCSAAFLSSLGVVEAFIIAPPVHNVQKIHVPARRQRQQRQQQRRHSGINNGGGGDRDARHGAIDTAVAAAAVVSVSSDGGDGGDERGDRKEEEEEEEEEGEGAKAIDIDSMLPDSVTSRMEPSSKEEALRVVDAQEVAEEASTAAAVEAPLPADDTQDGDDATTTMATSSNKAKVSASASAAALREATLRRQTAETQRRAALASAAAKEEDRQLAALTEQRLAAAAAAAIQDERRRQAAILEEKREARRRVVEVETQRAIRGEQSLSQAEKNQRFRREAAAAFGVKGAGKQDKEQDRGVGEGGVDGAEGGVIVTPRQAYAQEERSAQRQAADEFTSHQQSRRDELSQAEANRRADAALPVEVIGTSGVASEQRRLDDDTARPYNYPPPMRPPRPGGRATDADDRSPGFVGFSNARTRYPQRSRWVQKLQAEMLGKPLPEPPMDVEQGEGMEEEAALGGGGVYGGGGPPPQSVYGDYQPIDVGGRGGMSSASPPLPPKEEDETKKKPTKGNRVLTPRAPYPSSPSTSSSSPPSTTPSPGRVPATPVNLERFGDAWFQEQLRASRDEQGGEVHWYEGRRRRMVREEQERRERREALEAAMERERLEREAREAAAEAAAEADELEKAEATAQSIDTAEENSQADDEERKQRERIAAVLEVDEVRAELEKEREAIKAELEKKRAEAAAAREAKLERERMAQEAAAKAVEEQIKAAEEEIAAVEEQVQDSSVPAVVSDTTTGSGAEKEDSPVEVADNDVLALDDKVKAKIESEAKQDDKVSEDAEGKDVPPISIDDSVPDTEDDEDGETYNTYKAETIERRLASLQKDVAKSSEMVEEMSIEVSDLEEEYAHATKMLRRAQDRKNEKLIRIRSDDAAYVKAQLIDMSQELDILKRELACKEELLLIYEKRSDMVKRKEWSEGRGPIKSLQLTEWDHREEKEW